jgi:HEAT repeat protein
MAIARRRCQVVVFGVVVMMLLSIVLFWSVNPQARRAFWVKWYSMQLKSSNERVRKAAAEHLGDMREISAIPDLIAGIGSDAVPGGKVKSEYRGGPIRGRMDPAPSEMPQTFKSYRDVCRDALCKIGEPAIQHLIVALGSKQVMIRQGAADALGQFGARAHGALSDLETLKNDNSEEGSVRYSAAVAIMKIEGKW